MGEFIVLPLGIGAHELDEGAPADLFHHQSVQHAVVHPGLGHRHEPTAVIPPVAHGHQGEVVLDGLAVQLHGPVGADALEQEVHQQRGDIAAFAVQNGAFAVFMYVPGHPGVDAGAGDGQGHPAIDVDGVHGELGAVPQVLGVPELVHIAAEVFQEVVAGAHGDHAHGGVVIADDAVCHLVDGAVAAAGVKPQGLPGLTELLGDLGGVALFFGEDALHVQTVSRPQVIGHFIDPLAAVIFPRGGVDDKDVLHCSTLPAKFKIRLQTATYCSTAAEKYMNNLKISVKFSSGFGRRFRFLPILYTGPAKISTAIFAGHRRDFA